MSRQSVMRAGLVCVCACVLAHPALGAPDPLDDLLARIGSDSFEQRTSATQELAAATNVDDSMLVQKLKSGQLSPEVTLRVMEVVRQRFTTSPRGAIGIQFAQSKPGEPPRVMQAYKGYPACRADIVRTGDEFLEVEGESLVGLQNDAATRKVKAAIFSRVPGESVHVKLRRPPTVPKFDDSGNLLQPGPDAADAGAGVAEIIEVDIPLGRSDMLQAAREEFLEQQRQIALQQIELARQQQAQKDQQDGKAHQPPVVVIEPGVPGAGIQGNQVLRPQNLQQSRSSASTIEVIDMTNAWNAYVRRMGLPVIEGSLSVGGDEPVAWDDPGANAALGRSVFQQGGRVLAGPVVASAGTIAGLRNSPNVERNQEVLRNLAGGVMDPRPEQAVVANVGGAQVIKLGDNVNRVEIQVIGQNNAVIANGAVQRIRAAAPRGRVPTRADVEARIDGAREELAAGLARVEAEIRRLTSERAGSPDDLSTTRLVDERIAELRAEWEALRAQVEAVASGVDTPGPVEQTID